MKQKKLAPRDCQLFLRTYFFKQTGEGGSNKTLRAENVRLIAFVPKGLR